jgi:hypothetical protein
MSLERLLKVRAARAARDFLGDFGVWLTAAAGCRAATFIAG